MGILANMPTRPCPHCHEIIPADVDYCPFCGESTRETLETEDDLIRLRNLEARQAEGTQPDIGKAADGLPPEAGEYMCLMCHMKPATIDDYCLECHEKLDLKPEHWEEVRKGQTQRMMIVGGLVAVVLIVAIILMVKAAHHHPAPVQPPSGTTVIISD